ncbi:MAG: PEP-CTERM sorting domain-containing protein [Novosphingobium sp.]
MSFRIVSAALLIALGGATPALANSVAVPEPTTLALFGLGVAGVIIGRRGGRSRRD